MRYFTPQLANNTLPLVKKIVEDILAAGSKIKALQSGYPGNENYNLVSLEVELKNYLKELEDIGCSYKDYSYDIGLVDFPAFINDEEVLLCWRSDEDSISYYHSLDGGYASRKPIPEKYYQTA